MLELAAREFVQQKLLVVVVYDEPLGPERLAVRLCGYRACRLDHGVLWGGAANSRTHKNLAIRPRHGATGVRIDARQVELLELGLRLDHRIDQAVRYQPSARNRQFRLPRRWAGYRAQAAAPLRRRAGV